MKTKNEIAVKASKKVAKILEMFGEEIHPNATKDKYWALYRKPYTENVKVWMGDNIVRPDKALVTAKELKQILAREKLKVGDYVVLKNNLKGKIVNLGCCYEFKIIDEDGDNTVCDISDFKRYATKEEIELLDGDKVDKFAELKEAHKNGAVIEYRYKGVYNAIWKINNNPAWHDNYEYRIKPEEKPKVGDVCKFWNDDEDTFEVNKLIGVHFCTYSYSSQSSYSYKNAKKISKQEVLTLLGL